TLRADPGQCHSLAPFDNVLVVFPGIELETQNPQQFSSGKANGIFHLSRLTASLGNDLLKGQILVLIAGNGKAIDGRRKNDSPNFHSLPSALPIPDDGFLLGSANFLVRRSKEA